MPDLTQLGERTPLPASPEDAVIECIDYSGPKLVVRFHVPEFTSCCPITGAPDFARLIIDYVPNKRLVESKSLKLYMGSFRNHGAFHEKIASSIGLRLFDAMEPIWIRIVAFFAPRGGIPIDVFWERGLIQNTMGEDIITVPPLDLVPYRMR